MCCWPASDFSFYKSATMNFNRIFYSTTRNGSRRNSGARTRRSTRSRAARSRKGDAPGSWFSARRTSRSWRGTPRFVLDLSDYWRSLFTLFLSPKRVILMWSRYLCIYVLNLEKICTGQWLWHSWQRGRFLYQRTSVRMESSANFIEHVSF